MCVEKVFRKRLESIDPWFASEPVCWNKAPSAIFPRCKTNVRRLTFFCSNCTNPDKCSQARLIPHFAGKKFHALGVDAKVPRLLKCGSHAKWWQMMQITRSCTTQILQPSALELEALQSKHKGTNNCPIAWNNRTGTNIFVKITKFHSFEVQCLIAIYSACGWPRAENGTPSEASF